jgi:hypothetical protein
MDKKLAKNLLKLRRRHARRVAAIKRHAARPILPPINWAEVDEISALCDASAEDPHEWS